MNTLKEFDNSDITKCLMCNGMINNPKILPCIHTFCLSCLDKHIQDLNSEKLSTCPICKKEFIVPEGGLEKLKTNFFVKKAVDSINKEAEKENSRPLCDICSSIKGSKGNEISTIPAKQFCLDCKQYLCDRCLDFHTAMKSTTLHKLFKIGSDAELSTRSTDVSCQSHPKEKIATYCLQCEVTICRICLMSEHLRHKICDIFNAKDKLKVVLHKNLMNIFEDINMINDNLSQMTEKKEKFLTTLENIGNDLDNKELEIKKKIEQKFNKIKDDLAIKKEHFLVEIENLKISLQNQKLLFDSFAKYSQEVLNKASAFILVDSAKYLNKRAEELHKTKIEFIQFDIEPKISFSKLLNFESNENPIGNMELNKSSGRRDSYSKYPNLINSIDVKGYAVTLALVNDEFLYCGVYGSDEIKIYNIAFKKIGSFKVEGLKNPYNLIVIDDFIFLSEWRINTIYKIPLADKNKCDQWNVAGDLNSLSKTAENTLLIVSLYINKIFEYSLDGIKIREIRVDNSIDEMYHAIQYRQEKVEQFFVCHAGTEEHRICLIDNEGKILKSYGKEKGNIGEKLNGPLHMEYDPDGYLFVSDHYNHRIIVLSAELELIKEIIPPNIGLSYPFDLCYNEKHKMLHIADQDNKRFVTFQFV